MPLVPGAAPDLFNLTEALQAEGIGPASEQQLRDWVLVLRSRRIAHRVVTDRKLGTHQLYTTPGSRDLALHEIRAYERESEQAVDLSRLLPVRASGIATPAILLLLSIWFLIAHPAGFFPSWYAFGAVNGDKILTQGEVWRLATALTLHADLRHLLGNVLIGGIFANWYCKLVGNGVGWLSILLSGVLGNLLNLTWMGLDHRAVGASTAVFGTVGLLAGLRGFVHREHWFRDTAVPLVVGIIIVSFFGIGGERTDVGAHFAGLILGSILGGGIGKYVSLFHVPGHNLQQVAAWVALALILLSWILAVVLGGAL